MLGSTITRIRPGTPAQRRPRVSVVIPTYNEAATSSSCWTPTSNPNTWRDGFRVLRALLVEPFNGKGRNVEIVRTEPRDVAPVIALPVRMHDNRVIQPLDVPAGTLLDERLGYDPESYDPGPLARALMALDRAGAR